MSDTDTTTNEADSAIESAPAPTIITPTVGRRVHFYPNDEHQAALGVFDAQQPCDAGVIYVWGDRNVNLEVTGPSGAKLAVQNVTLVQDGDDIPEEGESYAAWMPYQTKQAAAQATGT
ncbi:MAG TPA: hypothetical protein VGE36_13710 [Roseateles sp.]